MWHVRYSGQCKCFQSEIEARLFAKLLRKKGTEAEITFEQSVAPTCQVAH